MHEYLFWLFVSFFLTIGLSWVAAKVVSAPKSDLGICAFYAALAIVVSVIVEVAAVMAVPQKLASSGGPLPFWVFIGVTIFALIGKFWVTMRLFDVGFLRALCIFIVVSVLGRGLELLLPS